MSKFVSVVELNKIPVVGLVVESSATAPSSPVSGQLWNDTSVSPNKVRWYRASDLTWVAADGTSIPNAYITDAMIAAANKDGTAGVASLRTLGTGAQQAVAGTDARLSDARPPNGSAGGSFLNGSYPSPGMVPGSITGTEIAAAIKDAVAGTASLRTLGSAATSALAGNTPLNSIAAPTANVDLNNLKIINLATPTNSNDAARLIDIQVGSVAGIDNKPSARVGSTANLTLSGLSAIDTITPVAGDRILVKNQTTASQNGIYVAAAAAWARSSDTITPNTFLFVEEGAINQDTQWMVTNNGTITIGTTAINFSQFGAPGSASGTANRITVVGGVVDIAATYVGQNSLTTLGTVSTGTWNGTDIAVADGGTGASTAAAARANLGTVGKFSANLAALTAGVYLNVTHGLGTTDILTPSFKEISTGNGLDLDWRVIDLNTVAVKADVAFALNTLRIVVVG